jgi:hypothetical protein
MLGQIELVKAQKEHQFFYLFYKPANWWRWFFYELLNSMLR